jgi:hypothetical protein
VITWIRALFGRITRRRAAAPCFASILERTLRDADGFTLRLSTVERSVGSDLDGPLSRALLED